MRINSPTAKAIVLASLCSLAFSDHIATAQNDQKMWVQEQNVPPWVKDVFSSKKLDMQYGFSFHLNPFYLRGDFNGDTRADIAMLVKDRNSGKVGIGIFHARESRVFILGAGQPFGNGGDDFRWMDVWSVYSKGTVRGGGIGKRPPPVLRGEAVLVEKSESASALIYWDGKQYSWYQQGD